ncbi:MAG: TldD/PmbA family protein [candidate division Zixibacteria bacterium CG_4_9_14_3_um_filter_46_8]|nr:MAG: TldD/PmbA family protein [candidate division Zixibacteria bacterium CG_4_9_14_3_um_filter_46_8]
MIGKDRIFTILNGILKKSPAEQTEAVFLGTSSGQTRFANSYIHQNAYESSIRIFFRAVVGKKIGVVSTSSMLKDDLNSALLNAYNIAMNQCENPDFTELPSQAVYQRVKSHYSETAKFTPMQRAHKIKMIFNKATKQHLTVAGRFFTSELEVAVVNTNGIEAYQPLTSAAVNVTIMGDNSSGYAEGLSRDVRKIKFDRIAETATQKCLDSANPIEITPGKYNVILEPKAVAEIIEWMNYTGFGAKRLEEGTSFLSNRAGKKVMGENISIYDDGLDPDGLPMPFDFEGVPKRKVVFVKKGLAGNAVYDTINANRAGVKSTGHALTPDSSGETFSLNTFVAGAKNSLSSMISKTEKGILVTRFHYVNGMLDTRKALMTGMTRDGTFLIKKGKIVSGIKNLRFTESMLRAFSQVKMISRDRQAINTWWSDVGCIVAPTMLITGFNFSGKTEF